MTTTVAITERSGGDSGYTIGKIAEDIVQKRSTGNFAKALLTHLYAKLLLDRDRLQKKVDRVSVEEISRAMRDYTYTVNMEYSGDRKRLATAIVQHIEEGK